MTQTEIFNLVLRVQKGEEPKEYGQPVISACKELLDKIETFKTKKEEK